MDHIESIHIDGMENDAKKFAGLFGFFERKITVLTVCLSDN